MIDDRDLIRTLARGLDELFRFARVERGRLLAENMFAMLECSNCHLDVSRGWHGDADEVDFVSIQELSPIVAPDDCGNFQPGIAEIRRLRPLAPPASDDSNSRHIR